LLRCPLLNLSAVPSLSLSLVSFSLSVHAPPTLTTHNVRTPGSLACSPVSLFLTRSLLRSLPFTSLSRRLSLDASMQTFPPRPMQGETVVVDVTGSAAELFEVAIADTRNLPMEQPAQLTKQAG